MTEKGNGTVNMRGQSFIINIMRTQNHTWQGSLTWVNRKETLAFRSALELIKMIDSAMEIASPEEKEKQESW